MPIITDHLFLKINCVCLFLILSWGCASNENHSQNKVENLFYQYHLRNSPPKDIEKGIEILILKELYPKYKGVFYKIKTTNKFYFGILDTQDHIIASVKVKGKENVSLFDNKHCLVLFNRKQKTIIAQDEDDCFTFFIGEIPFEGYSKIQLDWNCSDTSETSEDLIAGKYFFFFKEGLGNDICNIKLLDNKGQTDNLFYNEKTGLFSKKPTSEDN